MLAGLLAHVSKYTTHIAHQWAEDDGDKNIFMCLISTLGEAAIDWLISWYFAKDRNEACTLARELLCMFYPCVCCVVLK